MVTIVFVRHGEAENNVENITSTDTETFSLTENGKERVDSTAKELAKIPNIDALFTSPIKRAMETAAIISDYVNLPAGINFSLAERGLGKYDGFQHISAAAEIEIKVGQVRSGYPDYESWESLTGRMRGFINYVKDKKLLVAVSHGDPIRAAIGLGCGYDEVTFWQPPQKGSFTIIDFSKKKLLAFSSLIMTDKMLAML